MYKEYLHLVSLTDKLGSNDEARVLGIYGELGSLMTVLKKKAREPDVFVKYSQELLEESGDLLWYLASVCQSCDYSFEKLFEVQKNTKTYVAIKKEIKELSNEAALLKLGSFAASISESYFEKVDLFLPMQDFSTYFTAVLAKFNISLSAAIKNNSDKIRNRFVLPGLVDLPDFDSEYLEYEQIPKRFRIEIGMYGNQSRIRWNGVFIGDPLTDNSHDQDGYKYHDIFHFAYAAILHWSPVFRGLIRQKRKSQPKIDENEDGGRASVIEEGLTAWVFSNAKDEKINYFEDKEYVSFDILKNIQLFVQGYEVDRCPLVLWERAILQGFAVFRAVKQNNGGIIIGDRRTRTLTYSND